jgi:integrase
MLSGPAVEALRQHRSRQLTERLALGPEWDDRDLVFANTLGRPIEASNLHRSSFKPLLLRAGLPDTRFHDLRHTCASLLFARNVHPKVVQEMLGHATISITLDLYSHMLPDMQRDAAKAMEAILTT